MNDISHLPIPTEQLEAVTKTVLALYGARAESLGAVVLAVVDLGEDRAEIEHTRSELRAMEDALIDLGWPNQIPDGATEIVGPPRVLREVARMALLDSADRIVEAARRYETGSEELGALRRAVDAVPALFGLFATVEADCGRADRDAIDAVQASQDC
jgi:hypothetical protein